MVSSSHPYFQAHWDVLARFGPGPGLWTTVSSQKHVGTAHGSNKKNRSVQKKTGRSKKGQKPWTNIVPYEEIIEEMIGSKCQQGISNTGQLAFPQNVRHKRSIQFSGMYTARVHVLLTASRSALMAAHGTSCLSRKGWMDP